MNGRSIRRAAVIALVAGSTMAATATASSAAASSTAAGTTAMIRQGACTSAHKTWVHVTFVQAGHDVTNCYGGAGTLDFSANVMIRACAGNNHGSIAYNSGSGEQHWNFSAGQSKSFPADTSMLQLTINGWSGSDSC